MIMVVDFSCPCVMDSNCPCVSYCEMQVLVYQWGYIRLKKIPIYTTTGILGFEWEKLHTLLIEFSFKCCRGEDVAQRVLLLCIDIALRSFTKGCTKLYD